VDGPASALFDGVTGVCTSATVQFRISIEYPETYVVRIRSTLGFLRFLLGRFISVGSFAFCVLGEGLPGKRLCQLERYPIRLRCSSEISLTSSFVIVSSMPLSFSSLEPPEEKSPSSGSEFSVAFCLPFVLGSPFLAGARRFRFFAGAASSESVAPSSSIALAILERVIVRAGRDDPASDKPTKQVRRVANIV
jgi:hypothetical protein